MPSGCAKDMVETSTPTEWFIDIHNGDSNQCNPSRAAAFNTHCEVSDAKQQWSVETPEGKFWNLYLQQQG